MYHGSVIYRRSETARCDPAHHRRLRMCCVRRIAPGGGTARRSHRRRHVDGIAHGRAAAEAAAIRLRRGTKGARRESRQRTVRRDDRAARSGTWRVRAVVTGRRYNLGSIRVPGFEGAAVGRACRDSSIPYPPYALAAGFDSLWIACRKAGTIERRDVAGSLVDTIRLGDLHPWSVATGGGASGPSSGIGRRSPDRSRRAVASRFCIWTRRRSTSGSAPGLRGSSSTRPDRSHASTRRRERHRPVRRGRRPVGLRGGRRVRLDRQPPLRRRRSHRRRPASSTSDATSPTHARLPNGLP